MVTIKQKNSAMNKFNKKNVKAWMRDNYHPHCDPITKEVTSLGYQKLGKYWVKPIGFSVFIFNDFTQIIRNCFIGANGAFLTWSIMGVLDLDDLRWYEYSTSYVEGYAYFETLMNNVQSNQELEDTSDTILDKIHKIGKLVDNGEGELEDAGKLISELSVLIPGHSKLHQIELEIQRIKLMKRFSKNES